MNPTPNPKKALRDIHPVLYLFLPLLALYSSNPGQVLPGNLIRPAFLFLITAAVLWTVLYFVTRQNVTRTSLCVSLFFFAFTSFDLSDMLFGNLEDAVYWCHAWIFNRFSADSFFKDRPIWVLGLWGILTVALFYLCLRTRRDIIPVIWIAGIALIALPLWQVGRSEIEKYRVDLAIRQRQKVIPVGLSTNNPDLYVIVLDTYGRQDILKTMYGLDNEPFLRALEARGFLVARQSRANYIQTPLALAATLNMDYLMPDPNGGSWGQVSPSIDRNRVVSILKQRGYRYLSIPTGFYPTATPSADTILDDGGGSVPWRTASLTPFEELLLTKTPLSVIPRTDNNGFGLHRKRILAAFSFLGQAAPLPYPKFVFAHILSPHPPFVFCADGNPCAPVGQTVFTIEDASSYHEPHDVYRAGYAGQVQFVNKHILASLDEIKAKATRPYIIVLMGDHGARCLTDWGSRENTDVHEAFANLFAVYCPPGQGEEQDTSLLSRRMNKVITPVNGMRLVFNGYFGTDYPDLPDRSFYSKMDTPLHFEEVTDDLNTISKTSERAKRDLHASPLR